MDWPPQKAKAQGYVCISYVSIAVIKYHGQKQRRVEHLFCLEAVMARGAWQWAAGSGQWAAGAES